MAGELLKEIHLTHDQNYINIELVGLHFSSPLNQKYAYRIKNESKEWNNLENNRKISLARLSPGSYIIEGKASNPDGIWSDPKEILKVVIAPPFWGTTWFVFTAAIVFFGGVMLLYKWNIRRVRKAEIEKTEVQKRFAELEMKALRAQVNPHFLFNSLNSIRLLIDKGDNQAAKTYLTKFSRLIRRVLDNSSYKFIRLEQEIEVLKLYLELEKMRFKDFIYSINIDNSVNTDFVKYHPYYFSLMLRMRYGMV